jgi:hypothetical protein
VLEKGDLADTPFPLLLARHNDARSDGTLSLILGRFTKRVYLRSGAVVFASSDDRNDRLGETLIRRGMLGLPEFHRASSEMRPGKRFGGLLVEKGFMTPKNLIWSVKEQVKEIIFSLFDQPAGPYTFTSGDAAGEEVITLNMNTPELIKQGVERMDRIAVPLSVLNHPDCVLSLTRPAESVLSSFATTTEESEAVLSLENPVALEELCRSTSMIHFSLIKFLWALHILGMLNIEPGEGRRAPSRADDLGITAEDLQSLE